MRKRWFVGLLSALLLGVSLGVIAAGGGASTLERANPPAGSGAGLKKLQKQLEKALDEKDGNRFNDLIKDAIDAKRKWIGKAFGSQTVSGCNAGWLLERFDAVDVALEAAAHPKNKNRRKKEIEKAIAAANSVAVDVGTNHENCPKPVEAEVQHSTAIFNLVEPLSSTEPPSDEVRRQVAARKSLFMGEERVYGCVATEYLVALEQIDIPLAVASDIGDDDGSEQLQRRLVSDAKREIKKFRRYWRKVPCQEPGTGTATTTGTGSTTTTSSPTDSTTTTPPPPPVPQCSDGVDNDSDGNVDQASDTGCLSAQDTTELTNVWPFHYPGDGGSGTDWIDFKPFFGPFDGMVMAYRVFFGTTTVHNSTEINHSATPINGSKPCAFLGATGIRAGRGAMAPTGGPLGAAPDSDHIRIVIDTVDPAGGGTCGFGPFDLEVATDTRAP
jgi:hypothetical protein